MITEDLENVKKAIHTVFNASQVTLRDIVVQYLRDEDWTMASNTCALLALGDRDVIFGEQSFPMLSAIYLASEGCETAKAAIRRAIDRPFGEQKSRD